MDLGESKELDLSVPLKDLSSESFFAVHFNFLKHLTIPSIAVPSSLTDSSNLKPKKLYGNASNDFNTSFLVYYRICP